MFDRKAMFRDDKGNIRQIEFYRGDDFGLYLISVDQAARNWHVSIWTQRDGEQPASMVPTYEWLSPYKKLLETEVVWDIGSSVFVPQEAEIRIKIPGIDSAYVIPHPCARERKR